MQNLVNNIELRSLAKDFSKNIPKSILGVFLSEQSIKYFEGNDFAFIVALIADQSISSERAWLLPQRLAERLGEKDLTPSLIIKNRVELAETIRKKPSLHRYPNKMADYITKAAINYLEIKIKDGEIFTRNSDFKTVQKLLMGFQGISTKKAGLGILIQSLDYGKKIPGQADSVALLDSHVSDFLVKTIGGNKRYTVSEATNIFRVINPQNPALVSTWIWKNEKL